MKSESEEQSTGKIWERKIMRRQIFVWLLATLLLTTGSARAQQPAKIPRIGFESDSPVTSIAARVDGFRQGLRELGYVEGKNIAIEWRSAELKPERRSEIAAELV